MELEILVLGAGMAGLSTAWHLARAKRGRVHVLDSAAAFSAASAQNAGILLTLLADDVEAALARRSSQAYDELGAARGEELVDRRGVLLVDATPDGRLAAVRETSRRGDAGGGPSLPIETLGRAELATRAPFLSTSLRAGLFRASDGVVRLDALRRFLVSALAVEGGVLSEEAEVEELVTEGARVAGVRLASGEVLRADRTVLAAGAWASALGARAGSPVRLVARRRHLAVTVPFPELDPAAPVVWVAGRDEFYCRPVPDEQALLLCACDSEVVRDPDRLATDPSILAEMRRRARLHLDLELPGRAARVWCGLRTFASDGRFVVGPDPELDDLVWVAGLGGAGITTGLEVGRIAAAWVLGDEPEDPVAAALHPSRSAAVHA